MFLRLVGRAFQTEGATNLKQRSPADFKLNLGRTSLFSVAERSVRGALRVLSKEER